jgi:hypothetical protein
MEVYLQYGGPLAVELLLYDIFEHGKRVVKAAFRRRCSNRKVSEGVISRAAVPYTHLCPPLHEAQHPLGGRTSVSRRRASHLLESGR